MHLVCLRAQDFRCLEALEFRPEPGINIIRGGNAQGKTSLLEAIFFAATSRSHRTTLDTDLVRHGAEGFRIEAHARRRDRDVAIEATLWGGVKRFKVNGVAQTRLSDILGKLNVVLFSPEDITLVKGTAAHRRKFLDMALSQLDAAYLNTLQRYRQALRQRNELLRALEPDRALLEVWDAQLAEYGAELVANRAQFIQQLAGRATVAYGQIAETEGLSIAYHPDVPAQESLLEVLARTRDADIKHRHTSRGPHRDDFTFLVEDRRARSYASQGQQKTAALAVKLAELALARDRTGEYPVLMLDEVLSGLDDKRARRLFGAVGHEVQCLITTAKPIPDGLGREPRWPSYYIERGRLEKE